MRDRLVKPKAMMAPARTALVEIFALTMGLMGLLQANPADAAPAADQRAANGPVRVVLTVVGCNRCAVTPVQTTPSGDSSYWGQTKTPTAGGEVRFLVPRSRVKNLSFVVEPSFRTALPMGSNYPVMAITQFRAKKPGTPISWKYATKRRSVSGCIARVAGDTFTNTLVIRRVQVDGQPRAAAYLKRGVRSRPYWSAVRKASKHLSEALICG